MVIICVGLLLFFNCLMSALYKINGYLSYSLKKYLGMVVHGKSVVLGKSKQIQRLWKRWLRGEQHCH